MKQALLLKIGAAAAAAAAAGGIGVAVVNHSTGSASPAASPSVSRGPTATASTSAANPAGGAGDPATTNQTAAVPDSNSNVVTDDSNKDAVDRFGQDQFNKAVQTVDMFVGLAHGDCNRLAGKSDPAVALPMLLTPDALQKFTNPSALFWTPPAGTTFPENGCATPSRTTWTAKVEGTDDPTLWLTGTAVTTMHPTGGKTFKVTQRFELGLVPMSEEPGGSPFGWQANDAHVGKAETSNA